MTDPSRLAEALTGVDTVLHLAGVNRAPTDQEVEQGNAQLASTLAEAMRLLGRSVHVVYANSVQADLDNAYGRGKSRAGEILGAATAELGGSLADVKLPNLFGEHGRPAYNSFVATFANEVAAGREPTVSGDRSMALLHAQDAAAVLITAIQRRDTHEVRPPGEARGISEVLDLMKGFHSLYSRGEVPDLSTKFAVDLFNTYRSYLSRDLFPFKTQVHADARGELFETLRSHGGNGQAFVSTTVPGATRGDHYHLNKVERFFVVKGEAEIKLRRLLHDDVVTLRLSGEAPSFADMPTMWVHNIKNVGETELVTMFWAHQLLDPVNPDQFPELVVQHEVPA